MAQDAWAFAGRSNACMACQKTLVVGDTHFSALFQEQAELLRRDYCETCWTEQRPEGYFSFWRGTIPEPEEVAKKKRRLDASLNVDTLFDILKEMPDDPDPAKRRFRFVLSLMIMRRKKLKLLQIARRRHPSGEGTEDFLVMQTTGRRAKRRFEIADVKMNAEQMIAAQDEVGRLLALGGVEDAVAGGLANAEGESRGATSDGQHPAGERSDTDREDGVDSRDGDGSAEIPGGQDAGEPADDCAADAVG